MDQVSVIAINLLLKSDTCFRQKTSSCSKYCYFLTSVLVVLSQLWLWLPRGCTWPADVRHLHRRPE